MPANSGGGGFSGMSQGMDEGMDGALSLIGSFFEDNPYIDMMNTYRPMQDYITPYTDAGKQGLSGLQALLSGQLSNMTSNPTGLEDSIMSKYQSSPYATEQMRALTQAQNNAAAAGGTLGTPQMQQELAERLQGVIGKDQQQYLQNAIQPYEYGLGQMQQGYGQQIGAGEFGTNLQNQYLENMANMMGGHTQWNNQMTESRVGDIGSMLNSPNDTAGGALSGVSGMFSGGGGGMLGGLMGLL
jgi:hypothetical protein